MCRTAPLFIFFTFFVFGLFQSCHTVRRIEKRIDRIEAREIKNEEYIKKVLSELERIKEVLADLDSRVVALEEKVARGTAEREVIEKIRADISRILKRVEFVESRVSFLERSVVARTPRRGKTEKKTTRRTSPSDQQAKRKIARAKELIVNGKYDEAIDVLNSLFAEGYDSAELRFTIGDAFFRKGDYNLAIRQWLSIIEKEDELRKNKDMAYIIPRTYLRLAHAFLRLGDKKNAGLMLRAITLKYPQSPEAKTARDMLNSLRGGKK